MNDVREEVRKRVEALIGGNLKDALVNALREETACNCYVAGLPPSAAARNPPHALYCPERAR